MTRRQSPTETILHRHPHLWPMLDPKTYPTGYFLEPVLKWWPDWRSQTDAKELDIGHSQRMSATRDRLLRDGDAQQRWAAIGNIGELRKVRK